MNVETTVAHNRYRKLSILLGILGMCLLAVIIGLIASSRLNDDKQVIKKLKVAHIAGSKNFDRTWSHWSKLQFSES